VSNTHILLVSKERNPHYRYLKKDNTRPTLVPTPNLGETKGMHLTFAKPRLYRKHLYGKLLKALKNGTLERLARNAVLYRRLLANVKHLPFISPNLGVLTSLEHFIKCQTSGQIPFLNMSYETLKDNSGVFSFLVSLFRGIQDLEPQKLFSVGISVFTSRWSF
jgi:hypothetical protein